MKTNWTGIILAFSIILILAEGYVSEFQLEGRNQVIFVLIL